ncbi:MAG: alanine--tRNA ligase [Flavobacteriales bacterium]|nr:alanine--tRNA ligase [Flavobacteriales bacterium]
MTSQEIRQTFLDFFKDKKHLIVPSAPIVLKDDPTLLFTNSGMNQFKDFFLGYKKPKSLRTVDTQKCLRVSGKHNDLDDVGKDTYHHTMFEMLGNWSFGDYFKEETIAWSWELLTEVFKIPKDWLYVTVFEGDKNDGLGKDTEAYSIWKKYIAEERILNGDKKDNFWEMGATGPCGPCSEIHVDIRSEKEKQEIDGKELVNKDHPQVIEIWNLVFMEFLRKDDNSLEKLPKQNIDTGMGFERLCMVLQGKKSNYDTDVFTPLISKVEKLSGISYGAEVETDIAIRVVVDHIRAVSFAIADGQLPTNTGAGYVIRRILRRATSYGFRFLNQKEPFLFELVEVLKNQMEKFFPEIGKNYQLIRDVIKEEEISFLRTLDKGLVRLEQIINDTKNSKKIDGRLVYELHDTYGFPSDLSRIIAEEKGLSIDEEGFEKERERIKTISKKASESKTFDWKIVKKISEGEFIGYDTLESEVEITRYRKIENKNGTYYQLVFNKTPFYAESGGQVGDTGILENQTERITILDTKKENNLIVHFTKELPKEFSSFTSKVDKNRRDAIQRNHTVTHLLHEALREVLGTHVEQKGSYVSDEYLRFDFSHFSKLNEEELAEVSRKVNSKIKESIDLDEFRNIPFNEAVQKGAMALFGEKYGDNVRMIQFGTSKELCGGTHVKNTQDIFLFEILSESSIASGIRRIEAITGEKAFEYLLNFKSQIEEINEQLKTKDAIKSIEKLQAENDELKRQVDLYKQQQAQIQKNAWKNLVEEKNGINFINVKTDLEPTLIKDLVFQLKTEIDNLLIVVGSLYAGKPTITVGINDEISKSKKLNAGTIVRELAKEIQGGGGGQPTFATAGGKNTDGLDSALNKAKELF